MTRKPKDPAIGVYDPMERYERRNKRRYKPECSDPNCREFERGVRRAAVKVFVDMNDRKVPIEVLEKMQNNMLSLLNEK